MTTLTRITHDPDVMGGKPCIRGMRVTVGTMVGLVASGHSPVEILGLYPYLEEDDIREALSFCGVAGGGTGSAFGGRVKLVIDINPSPESHPITSSTLVFSLRSLGLVVAAKCVKQLNNRFSPAFSMIE